MLISEMRPDNLRSQLVDPLVWLGWGLTMVVWG